MLRYNIKLGTSNMEFDEMPYDTLFFAKDYTFISGLTSFDYDISNNQDIYIQFNNIDYYNKYKIEIETIYRRGYVLYNPISNYEIIQKDVNKFIYKDKIGFNVGEFEYFYDDDNKYFKFWCDNNIINIDGIDYEVDFELDSENVSITLENGTILYLNDYTKSDGLPNVQKLTKFIIRKNFDYSLTIENSKCVDLFHYILVQNDDFSNTKLYVIQENDKSYLTDNIDRIDQYTNKGDCTVVNYDVIFNGKTYPLLSEWININFSDKINLYLDEKSSNMVSVNDIIKVIPTDISNIWLDLIDEDHISYFGKEYKVSNIDDTIDYIKYNGNEYKLIYEDSEKTKAYITLYDQIIIFSVDNEFNKAYKKEYAIKTSYEEYDIIKYRYVTINNEQYIIETRYSKDGTSSYSGINLPRQEIRLIVEEIQGSNSVICGILDGDSSNLLSEIYLMNVNYKNYTFELFNPLFDLPDFNVNNKEEFLYHFNSINIYNPNKYYNLSIKLDNKTSNNIHQEYLSTNFFYLKEIEKTINRIVDMEKDVYYPYSVVSGKTYEIDELIFDLHFRTRNMDDWTINDETKDGYMCNWNILDNYKLQNENNVIVNEPIDNGSTFLNHKPNIQLNEELKYYQPSDLLYFLNFSDKDIYYQKQKVGKSFLRLSFFDSNDPKHQSLLHTSSIYINEKDLYKKFIDNRYLDNVEEGDFLTMDYEAVDGISHIYYDDSISVKDEFFVSQDNQHSYENIQDKILTEEEHNNIVLSMNESRRLSCRMSVKNRYNATESSEGFYLYMFKEYNDKFENKDIYLKIEFNHAGTGRVINFFMPTDSDGNLLDFSDKENVGLLKQGIPLNELYKKMFIKLKCAYDNNKKCYYYYLPSGLVKHNENNKMRFNLYEIKIKDELIYKNEDN